MHSTYQSVISEFELVRRRAMPCARRLLALESEHQRYKKQMEKAREKASENVSTGLDLSKGGLANLGLSTGGVVPSASLPSQQDVSSQTNLKASGTPSAFQIGVTASAGGGSPVPANNFGQHPLHSSAAQRYFLPPGAFRIFQPHAPKPLFPDFASGIYLQQ